MATYYEYKCKGCGYTKSANPKGHDMIISGDLYPYLCKRNMTKGIMKKIALLCVLLVPTMVSAQTQYLLPTGDASMDEKDRPLIEVYLPKTEMANGCAVILCPGGAMRWLSWESDVIRMASFLNEHGIAAIGLRYHLNKGNGQMPQGM